MSTIELEIREHLETCLGNQAHACEQVMPQLERVIMYWYLKGCGVAINRCLTSHSDSELVRMDIQGVEL